MFIFVRALTYATFFIGFVLIALPARLVDAAALARPVVFGPVQMLGMAMTLLGAIVIVACIVTFVTVGRGTPAPFDPPRRLVVRGPYALIRNPMYLGAALAMSGAAVFYQSAPLAAYVIAFLVVTHVFVIAYEEPTLRATFGADYDAYCATAGRWYPRRHRTTRAVLM